MEGRIKKIKKVIIEGKFEPKPFNRIEAIPFSALLAVNALPPELEVKYNDIMALMFTSGTTGPSKGVLITHNQAYFVASQYVSVTGVKKNDTGYCYIPLFHEAPQFGRNVGLAHAVLATGCSA